MRDSPLAPPAYVAGILTHFPRTVLVRTERWNTPKRHTSDEIFIYSLAETLYICRMYKEFTMALDELPIQGWCVAILPAIIGKQVQCFY